MKLTVCGTRLQSGTGKESGKPYAIPRLFTMAAIVPGVFGGMTIAGSGFEVGEVECTPEVVAGLVGAKFPIVLEIEMSTKVMAGKTSFIVTSAKA